LRVVRNVYDPLSVLSSQELLALFQQVVIDVVHGCCCVVVVVVLLLLCCSISISIFYIYILSISPSGIVCLVGRGSVLVGR